jgi:hypothetical protein
MAKIIGLSRSIRLEWLNKTVELVLEGKNETQIKDGSHHEENALLNGGLSNKSCKQC